MKKNGAPESSLALSNRIQAIHCLFASDERLLYFLFHHKKTELREPPRELLKEARHFNSQEFLLVRVAIDIWHGQGGNAKLSDLLNILDDDNLLRLLMAVAKIRGLLELEEILECYTL